MKSNLETNQKVHEFKTNLGNILIHNKEIVYIKALNKRCLMFCVEDKSYMINHSMKKLENELTIPMFYRVHSSYLINYCYVEYFHISIILLANGNKYKVPLSRSRVSGFRDNFIKFKEWIGEY